MIFELLYNLLIVPLMEIGLLLGSLFSSKARLAVRGRINEGARLARARSRCRDGVPRVLVHCSSAGELESAVPLLEEMKRVADMDIVLSYYSPSAQKRLSAAAEAVDRFYLPIDTPWRVRRLLGILEPSLVVFIKHDIWPNYVWQCYRRGVPTVLVDGNFRPDSLRLSPFARIANRSFLKRLTAIYAVAGDDAERFRRVAGPLPVIEDTGDTRYDRVRQRALSGRKDQGMLAKMLEGRKVVVAGSTWPDDEQRLLDALSDVLKEFPEAVLVLAPHEPTPEHLKQLWSECERLQIRAVTLSDLESGNRPENVIFIDRVGILAGLYGLGCAAYVGGAFGTGVHSVIEPAVFGLPVLFGPKYLMSNEARNLLEINAALSIEEAGQVRDAFLDALRGGDESRRRGRLASEFVESRTGTSERVAKKLVELIGR